jgi:hypothetical protein
MRILFLSYWGVQEGLTSATVLPHLAILSENDRVEKIIFCSIERTHTPVQSVSIGKKISHVPLFSQTQGSVFITKFKDFYTFPRQLEELCKMHRIDRIICRSSLAGALGYLVSRRLRIPYVVESFEPHADYMIDSGVWSALDPRLWVQRYFERKIKKTAKVLLPVSHQYQQKLLAEGVGREHILLMPCCVSINDFLFSESARQSVRSLQGIQDEDVVGIYVGKFGGIYYDEEAFELYAQAFNFFGPRFFLMVITADDQDPLKGYIAKYKIPADRVLMKKVPHREVVNYLSAADFAFSTIKPAPSRKYCSPIKDGEYWANGLPILIEDHIGDDSGIIKQHGGGVILDRSNPVAAFRKIKEILESGRVKVSSEILPIAHQYRSMELVRAAYAILLNE